MTGLRHAFFLARKHLRHHRGRTALLCVALFLVAFLPIAIDRLVDAGEQALRARADSTPLVAGAAGSPIDLVLSAIYFREPPAATISQAEVDALRADDLAMVLPLVFGDRVKGGPLVGTDPDYLEFRGLEISSGRNFAMAGECVVGAAVASREGIVVDDKIVTEPREIFDLAGAYPLRMRVVGVLAESGSPDDAAVFASTSTAWIVQGRGHGHIKVDEEVDERLVMGRTGGDDEPSVVRMNAAIHEFVEITPENVADFHFHGETVDLPVNAAIVLPRDAKAGTILFARAETGRVRVQLVRAAKVVDRLLVEVFRVRRILLAVLGVVAVATVLLIAVVIALSVRIRAAEIETMHLIGCTPSRVPLIIATEVVILVLSSGLAAMLAGFGVTALVPAVERLLLG